ncbi:MAG: DUF2334 domain-containing protein [Thermoplasmatales archaeon]|nr:DUF2334 domain-containing protein [Thermoplasmatales archaeon]
MTGIIYNKIRGLFYYASALKNHYVHNVPLIDKLIGTSLKNVDIFEKEEKHTCPWNNYIAAFNLNFDDFCTKDGGNGEYDFGGPNSELNKIFFSFLKKYPYLKVTMFMVPNPIFKNIGLYNEKHKENGYIITNPKYEKWVQWVKSQKNIEIACHGLYHYQEDLKYTYPSAEFIWKGESECYETLIKAKNLLESVGIEVYGMRPPAWAPGKNFALINAISKLFFYGACSTPTRGLNLQTKRVSNIYPQFYKNMLNIPSNLSIDEDPRNMVKVIDGIIKYNGLISLRGHYLYGTKYIKNGIDEENLNHIGEILDYLNEEYPNKIWYATLYDVAKLWRRFK